MPAVYPAFFFVLEKGSKSAGNAVIPTFPAHCPHGLQHLRHKRPTFAFTSKSAYTLGFRRKIAHKGTHAETGGVSDGGRYYYPRSVPHVHEHPRAGCQNGKFCRFWVLAGGCSRRTQRACGTAMRSCASLFRRRRSPAGLRCSVCNLVMLLFFHSARRAFHTCKRGCGITTLGVLRVLSKRWAAACQNSSFAVF